MFYVASCFFSMPNQNSSKQIPLRSAQKKKIWKKTSIVLYLMPINKKGQYWREVSSLALCPTHNYQRPRAELRTAWVTGPYIISLIILRP